jgi:hypothetical protein
MPIASGVIYTPENDNGLAIVNGVPATEHNGLHLAQGVRVTESEFEWTESDALGRITVPSAELGIFTFVGQGKTGGDHWVVHPNTGADYWNGDWEIKFRFRENNDDLGTEPWMRMCITTELAHTGGAAPGSVDGIHLSMFTANSNEDYYFQVNEYGTGGQQTMFSLTGGPGYSNPIADLYCKFYRSGNTIGLTTYSDSGYSSQVAADSATSLYAKDDTQAYLMLINTSGANPSGPSRNTIIETDSITDST